MDDNAGLILSLLLLALVAPSAAGGFVFGRKYENKMWERLVADQMSKLCTECMQAGRESL
jgi:hypothetical protein